MAAKSVLSAKDLIHELMLLAGNIGPFAELINQCFITIGDKLDVSRVYLFQVDSQRQTMSNTHEWVSSNVESQRRNLEGVACSAFPWFFQQLLQQDVIRYSDIQKIQDPYTRNVFELQNIQSVLVVSIHVEGKIMGFVGFDQCDYLREWSPLEEMILESLALVCARGIKEGLVEGQLYQEHQQLLRMVDNIGGISYAVDLESYKILFANKELRKLYASPLEGEVCYQALQGRTSPCPFCTNEQIESSDEPYQWEYYNQQLGRNFLLIDRRIRLSNGGFARFEIGVDITEREMYRKALRDEKELLRVTLMSIGDGVVTTNADGKITMMNKVAQDLTGWNLDDVLGKDIDDVMPLFDAITKLHQRSPLHSALKGSDDCKACEGAVLAALNHKQIPISNTAAPIRDKEGHVVGAVSVFRDISDKIRREKKIRALVQLDSITGLYNRGYFEQLLHDLDVEANLPLSVVLGDVNGLKMTNDVFGHENGDKLLTKIGSIIRLESLPNGVAARWGGDEFVVVLLHTNPREAEKFCTRVRQACNFEGDLTIPASLSMGVATKEHIHEDFYEVLYRAEERMYKKKLLESKSVRSSIIFSLRKTLFERSHETEEHAQRLGVLCDAVGKAMELTTDRLDEIQLLATLHDIGKISIRDEVLLKPAALNDEEWLEMKKHPEAGYRILQTVPELSKIAEYVLCHHERWDGKGYPQGLKGIDIPLPSRILAVADTYDAITNDRPYRKGLDHSIAIQEIQKGAGTQFDPRMVDLFIQSFGDNPDVISELRVEKDWQEKTPKPPIEFLLPHEAG
ncbi:MAG: diguanylate cyclase [Spirochaetales bacterium]|nr:diguanylate cyclase [Spirochaetales bacterium]